MPLFRCIDPGLGLADRELLAERIDYYILARSGSFFRPGDWRQLDAATRGTIEFVEDAAWRSLFRPASLEAMLAWDQVCWPPRFREDLPEDTARVLRTEGHYVIARMHPT